MASNVNNQEGECRQFNLNDLLKKWDNNEGDGDEEVTSPDKSEGGVSMFCKACLNPYSGEPKAGTIVLKCERCGQTDVVLEERAADLDPEEWSGNLMMNRFLQVLKEQEDLKLNIVDPYFVDDDYKHLILAIQEYTFNMKAIAEKMYDIAHEARMACELEERLLHEAQAAAADPDINDVNQDQQNSPQDSFNVVDRPREIKTDKNNENDVEIDQQQIEVEAENNPTNGEEGRETESGQDKWMPTSTKQKLKKLGETVTKLMYSIIQKHNLPSDVMDRVQYRIRHPSYSSNKDDTNEADEDVADETEAGGLSLASNEGSIGDIEDIVDDAHAVAADIPDATTSDEACNEIDTPVECLEMKSDKSELAKPSDESNALKDEENTNTVIHSFSDDSSASMVLAKEKIENEIFGVLKSKFKINFESTDEDKEVPCDSDESHENRARNNEKDISKDDEITSKATNETDKANHSQSDTKDEPDVDDRIHSHVINEIDTIATDELKQEDGEEEDEDESELQVNFYSISSAFINELQSRKRKALMKRKDKALKIVHEKIVALKQEVENVENRVHDELTSAYKKKLRKVENQRKQLDKRHETIQDVEKLMNHYARTGQNDKLAELMEQLDVQYEN